MVILALETATRRGSIALCVDGLCVAREGDDARTHGERLPGEVLEWLAQHGRSLGDVDAFAIVIGPGSFTGLRVGVAAVQGLALAGKRKVVPVPTLEAMAGAWLAARDSARPVIASCLDGQRGDVFLAAYDSAGAATIEECRVVMEPRAGRPEEAARELSARASAHDVVLVCSGARRYAAEFEHALPGVHLADVPLPLAEAAARLAMTRVEAAVRPHALRPIYLRRPDAELARERARLRSATTADELEQDEWRITAGRGAEDFAAVESLQRRAFTNPWGAEAIKWELENTDVARLYIMRGSGGTLAAYCACWMVFDELHINSLAVDEAFRRRGLARRLLRHVFGDARAAGARSATLEVRRSNQAARLLYEGLGFTVEGIRRDYYQAPREDALILWHRNLALFVP